MLTHFRQLPGVPIGVWALKALPQAKRDDLMSIEALEKFVTSTPQGPSKLATMLSQEANQLLTMDRYERRALSRRRGQAASAHESTGGAD